MKNDTQKIQVIREIKEEDRLVREALEIAERFKVLPYYQINAILETKLSNLTVSKQ